MSFDIKNDLAKNFLSDIKLGKNNVQSTINQTLVSSPGQKSIDMDLQNESTESKDSYKKKKKLKPITKKSPVSDPKPKSDNIERNPLKLLNLF